MDLCCTSIHVSQVVCGCFQGARGDPGPIGAAGLDVSSSCNESL